MPGYALGPAAGFWLMPASGLVSAGGRVGTVGVDESGAADVVLGTTCAADVVVDVDDAIVGEGADATDEPPRSQGFGGEGIAQGVVEGVDGRPVGAYDGEGRNRKEGRLLPAEIKYQSGGCKHLPVTL